MKNTANVMLPLLRLTLALVAFSSLAIAAELDISSAGNSNMEGTKQLFRFAEDIGCDVYRPKNDSEFFRLTQGDYKILISVKASATGVDRAVAHVVFSGKKEYANSIEMDRLLAKLNRTYNTCCISVDSDGDITFQFVLAFDNRISPKLFRIWCEHVSQCVEAIISEEPELRKKF